MNKIKKKSHRGAAKRFKKTKNGKGITVSLGRAFTSHIATHKTTKQKRQLRKRVVLAKGDGKRMGEMIG
jgi:large subunit ribosomal protein L35